MSYRDALAGLRERVLARLAELTRLLEGVAPNVFAHLPEAYRSLTARAERLQGPAAMSFEALSNFAIEIDALAEGATEALAEAERAALRFATPRRPRRVRKPRAKAPQTDGSAIAQTNFRIPTEERIRALTIGAPAWALRKRKIEDALDRFVNELLDLRDLLLARGLSDEQTQGHLLEHAATFELAPIQRLVEQHNRYYPMEANLPMSPSGYMISGEPWEPEPSVTAERLLVLVDEALEPVASAAPRSRRAPPSSRRRRK